MLSLAAPMISTYWLNDTLERMLSPELPTVYNSDGEDIEIVTLHYRLKKGVAAKKLRAALEMVPDLDAASATLWDWLAPGDGAKARVKQKRRDGIVIMSTMEYGATVLGALELKKGTLTLQVNSESRAERGRAMLEPVLEGLVSAPLIERQTLEQAMAADKESRSAPASSGLPPEEERRLIHAQLDMHYRAGLDEPIPALGDISPRKAAMTTVGREKVASWLKALENHIARQEPDDPMADYDLAWLWEELSVADLRK
jgi:hypothetical protein